MFYMFSTLTFDWPNFKTGCNTTFDFFPIIKLS